jgi:N-methylhydantoinase B
MIYEEGIRIPPVKIFNKGVLNDDILRLILLNCRINDIRRGDLNAQFACNKKGILRVQESCKHYGVDLMLACMDELLNYSERKMRMAIRNFPKGSVEFTDYLDSDGLGSGPVPLHVKIDILEDEIYLDFTKNPTQVAGAINLTDSGLRACIYYALKCIVDPSLPSNGGYYRPIRYAASKGTILSCKEPAAVAGRTDTAQRVCDLIFGAMAQLVPERIMAGTNGAITSIIFSGQQPDNGKTYVYLETVAGGSGARYNDDGLDAVQVHMTNTSNLPIECMEMEYPLRVEQYCMIQDSGGCGKYRGGLGIRKDIRIVEGECIFTVKADRHKIAPWGLTGGNKGMPGCIVINPGSQKPIILDSKKSGYMLPPGTTLSCQTPGSGGYGKAEERDRAAIVNDLEQGYISPKSALEHYGITKEELKNIQAFQDR